MKPHLFPDMAVFVAVVEGSGFTAAARSLGLSKSAVSKAVSRLEQHLGTRLLSRTTRQLALTEAGAAFYEGCRRTLKEAEAAETAVSELTAVPRGRLRVNAPMSFGIRHIAPALAAFMARHPELEVDLTLEDRLLELVEEGYDIALRIGALADSGLVARRLAPNRRLVVAAPLYIARHGRPQRPESLVGHDCLLYSYQASGDVWRFLGPEGSLVNQKVSGRLRINNGDALRTATLSGLGIAMLPSFIVSEDLRSGRLERLLPDWRDAAETTINAVYPGGGRPPPKVRAFLDFLVERFSGCPYWDQGLEP